MRILGAAFALATALSLGGCNTYDSGDRAMAGAGIGGITGALLGNAVSHNAGGTLLGAGVGAASGAVIGAATTPVPRYGYAFPPPPPRYGYQYGSEAFYDPAHPRCLRTGYDYYGNVVCLRWTEAYYSNRY